MKPLEILKRAVKSLEACGAHYCLVGGHAASLYRTQERLTRDVDFALVADDPKNSGKIAEKVIKSLGLRPVVGFIPPSEFENARKRVCMITASPAKGELTGVIDILLPELPWVAVAVERAQHNKINLGFAKVPVITPEDLIIAKCYALRNSPDRFQDLDDLKSIFQSRIELDRIYLRRQLSEMNLSIPDAVKKHADGN